MPLYRLLERQAFEPDHCKAMGLAYEAILKELKLHDRDDPLCEIVAKQIIELARRGMRDPEQLASSCIKEMDRSSI